MSLTIATLLQGLFVLLIAPFLTGLVRFCKARFQGRNGASPFLPYFTIATLFRKEMVISNATSWIFRAVPFVVLSSSVILALLLPLVFKGASLASMSDFLVISGTLIVGSIFLVLGGIDPGSAFGGMGSSREMTVASLIEPIIIMVFATLAVVTGSFTVDGMLGQNLILAHPYLIFSIIALCMIALAENARYPVDNPATHLELTMVHEAMILEYSGPYLAMLEYASSIKLTAFALLVANVIFPSSLIAVGGGMTFLAIIFAVLFGMIKVVIFGIVLALIESTIVKMRFYRMQEFFSLAFLSALSGMVLTLFARYGNMSVQYHAFFAALAILFVVLLFGRARLRAILRYYALSSLSIGGIAVALSFVRPDEKVHLWVFAIVTILIKVFVVPFIVIYLQRKQKKIVSLASFLKPASSYFLVVIILAAAFFAVQRISSLEIIGYSSLLYASVALISLGLAMMVVHRNVFSQIVGILVIENGISVFVLVTVESLPLLIEMGVFLITLSSAFIFSKLSNRIRDFYGSTDTEKLRNLIE
ncbi:MAG: Hydrogenase subunit [Candidatus Falkowbacteria bacterium GW2011_GWF2_39_8]|uniref:Hydrogenase subunit n=1 Tax=Candidatus Falkowbacteria bacterium GW2011_GWF2_39_8 TaxID=1618642 RepID=A0A0G0T4K6_9BACT|nr:MAG: Hydrogenase subunit [Candidatus Falkowbacteria bacterium GW2011_GWF2_39_8]